MAAMYSQPQCLSRLWQNSKKRNRKDISLRICPQKLPMKRWKMSENRSQYQALSKCTRWQASYWTLKSLSQLYRVLVLPKSQWLTARICSLWMKAAGHLHLKSEVDHNSLRTSIKLTERSAWIQRDQMTWMATQEWCIHCLEATS